ncbi:type II secretion system protein GspM [Xanthomonas vesicatoria]|uniref:Type II secretion system protein M n=2 Tax=Xanthomonas vesicatoria TaxID=56460 RepID=A0AAJ0IXU1_9XANT|nr:type II secretion system protein GspM [Xanthomonas vesicatoria]APO96439.1 type II secretion system protein M [Xanthomonas vesicatoria]APP76536.1 type II secretion system protein M [Xanthomonas vesicatoria ATCC 35937]EGD10440.1 Type II secretion system proteinM [Xanthomonas vesicatoria ATCC 35937]KHM91364.1 type II secretion system protein M [Xanthomonas vesicatoria]KHM93718.1 type II secretion system protein M [Xanthomonas vesicatoria]
MSTLQRMPVWWKTRAPRERIMLSVMVIAIAAFIGWYALLTPLRHWRSSAQARYDHAAQALLIARAAQPGGTVAAIPLARITQSARDATITITRQQRSPTGTLAVQIDTVTSPVLFAWLEQLRQRDGLTPSALEITRRDGQLQVRCTFPGIAL